MVINSNLEKYYGEYKTREVYKMIGDMNRKWQPKQRAIRDSNGKLLVNTTDIIQRSTTYCSELYMAQLDQKVSNDLVKELKDISPPLADSQGRTTGRRSTKGREQIEEQQKSRK